MRPIRSNEPGGHVLFEKSTGDGGPVSMTVGRQIAVDFDLRKLVDMLRDAIEERFRDIDAPPSEGKPTTETEDRAAGRTQYRWRTQRDERVRKAHRLREGRVFKWDEPPTDGHPGTPFGCRCWAEVYDEAAKRKRYRFSAITGDASRASCTIEIRPHFIDKERWAVIRREVIPQVIDAWLRLAVPSGGDGVGTPPRANVSPIE